jgi:hypothetical protein
MLLHVRRDGLVYNALRKPTLAHTSSLPYAERSRLVWSPDSKRGGYRLSLLGLLHGLVGLTLEVD